MLRRILLSIRYRTGLVLKRVKYWVMKLGAESDFWARVYYGFFDNSFVRENRSVLKGKVVHERGFSIGELNEYKIRRNIHRLEKGLIMPERREVFARDYIIETVRAFVQEKKSESSNEQLLNWAQDVLTLYFETSRNEGPIAEARGLFEQHITNRECLQYVPYHRHEGTFKSPDYYSFLELCQQRVSTRIYENKKVPSELINKALEATVLAPSACNRQPFEFIVFDKPEEVDKHIVLPGGVSGFDKRVPVLIFLVGDLSAYFDERDRHLIYIDGGLAAMTFMFALETLGLSSCALNWPDIEERELMIEKHLNLPKHKRCIMAITVGYPDVNAKVPFSLKKSLDQILRYKL